MVPCGGGTDAGKRFVVELMAKSKKPRKKYQGNRWNSLALMRPKELEDSIKNVFRRCERLQGFPDNWTRIPYRGKSAENCPDSPRYRAIGNSWAVPCVRWIGERIQKQFEGENK